MPTNRQILKEKVATYASVLLDGAYEAGGQDAVLEVRDQAERILRIARSNMDLSDALEDSSYTPEQRGQLVRNLFASSNPVLVDVLAVMAEREDFALLSRVWASYGEQLERKLNVTVVRRNHRRAARRSPARGYYEEIRSDLGTKVVLRESIDKSLIGGIFDERQTASESTPA